MKLDESVEASAAPTAAVAWSTILTEFQKPIGSKPISARNTAENKALFCFWGGFVFGIVFFLH
jgi:hypothetical protein